MTLKELYEKGKEILLAENIPEAEIDAWYLLEHICKINRTQYFIRQTDQVSSDEENKYLEVIGLRKTHMPYQYITGKQEFMGISFYVNPSVLIPRQDTEILVEEVIKKLKDGMQVLDMCTGSGCIIISLMMQDYVIDGTAVDVSDDALQVAKENALIHNKNIKFIRSDLFERVEGTYDMIVSNPPYISAKEMTELMREVSEYEPHLALFGKEDGLYFYRKIIEDSKLYLKDKGYLFFEIGYNQAEDVKGYMESHGFSEVTVVKDLASHNRVVFGHI